MPAAPTSRKLTPEEMRTLRATILRALVATTTPEELALCELEDEPEAAALLKSSQAGQS